MTNSSPWKDPPMFKFGKPSISMGHLYHGYVTNNQRVYVFGVDHLISPVCESMKFEHPFMYKQLPSGYLTVRHGKSPFLIGKPSINLQFSMAMLNNQMVFPDSINQLRYHKSTWIVYSRYKLY